MRILFIAPRFPFPLDTGAKIRTYNLIKQLAKNFKVDLACFSFGCTDKGYVSEFLKIGVEVHLITLSDPKILEKINNLLLNALPYSISKYLSREMEDLLRLLNKRNKYDLVHFDHLHTAFYRGCFNGQICVMDEHNVEFKILERCASVEKNIPKRILFSLQAKKMRVFESQKLRKFSFCLSVSGNDGDELTKASNNQTKIHVIPNGVDTDFFQPSFSDRSKMMNNQNYSQGENSLVFTGSLDWLPNDDAVVYFCKDILPLIWQQKADVRFYIVGKSPSARLRRLCQNENRIILTGRVDDVRSYVARAKIFVVPLRIGGGTRLKILEAMAMGKAVVSTRLGAEGIEYEENTQIVLADTPKTFAEQVLSLLNDPQKTECLGREAREFVCQKYDWNTIGEKLNTIYEKATHDAEK